MVGIFGDAQGGELSREEYPHPLHSPDTHVVVT